MHKSYGLLLMMLLHSLTIPVPIHLKGDHGHQTKLWLKYQSVSNLKLYGFYKTCKSNRWLVYCFYSSFVTFLELKISSPHPLSLYGKGQHEHFSEFLLLCSIQERNSKEFEKMWNVNFWVNFSLNHNLNTHKPVET